MSSPRSSARPLSLLARPLARLFGRRGGTGPRPRAARDGEIVHRDRIFRYRFQPAAHGGAPLLIAFHGRSRPPRAPAIRSADWNILFPLDDHGFEGEGSWFLGEDGDFFWLEALGEMVAAVHDGTAPVYCMGANMGGFAAIVHGLRLGAAGVYAHAPQTRLLATSFGQQGLRRQIRTVFGRRSDTPYADLRSLVRPGIATRFFLTARRWERADMLAEQFLPFLERLLGADVEVEADIVPGQGNMPPRPLDEIAALLFEVHEGKRHSLLLGQTEKAARPSAGNRDRAGEVEAALATTFLEPEKMWAKPYPHMTARFHKKLELFAQRADMKLDPEAIYERVRAMAEARREARPRTFFVASPGGSGSHWFQQILSHNIGTVPCGEVYLPEPMMELMLETGPELRGLMIDAMHLLHAYEVREDMRDVMLINTAHARGWRMAAHMPEPKTTIMLQRDPLDVVLSRAFRKQGLRTKQFPDLDDRTYLDQQLTYVRRFYEVRDIAKVDATVRYEDLRRDIGAALRDLAATGAVPVDVTRIEETKTAFDSGAMGQVNKYRGPKVVIPEALEAHARAELAGLRAHLGYGD